MIGTSIVKLFEGLHNKTFLLRMDDGEEIIARLPNPNAGPPFLTVASEVATRQFVCELRTFVMINTHSIVDSRGIGYTEPSRPQMVC
jgi:hypothetical protein